MLRRSNRLVFLILTLLALTVYWSCSQPDDVLTDISSSTVTLTAERLPTLPSPMLYELWVADAEDTVSLGRFAYNHDSVKYFDVVGTDTTERSNIFVLADDFNRYTALFVSVEIAGDATGGPGPIMLIDEISDDPVTLLFHQTRPGDDSLWRATVRYNMEGVSDNSRNAGDGQGLWFTTYVVDTLELVDSTNLNYRLDSNYVGTLELECDTNAVGETLSCDTINKDILFDNIDTITGEVLPEPYDFDTIWNETSAVQFGGDTLLLYPDTLWHIAVRYIIDSQIPAQQPDGRYYRRELFERGFSFDTSTQNIVLDMFMQDDFGLPDLSEWGFKYKGWVMSTNIDPADVGAGFTPPAWRYESYNETIIYGDEGGLLTTGTWSRIDQPDDGNPYVIDPDIVPSYPGEDFLNATAITDSFPGSTPASINPLRLSSGNIGTIFITLEPTNFVSRSNFPLIAFIDPLPYWRAEVQGTFVQRTMRGWMQAQKGDLYGFPAIYVDVDRH